MMVVRTPSLQPGRSGVVIGVSDGAATPVMEALRFRSPATARSSVRPMSQTLQRGPVTGTAAEKRRKNKPFLLDFYSTAVGKKYVMAITGIIGILFVIGHMIGNLKVYLGAIEEDGHTVYDIDVYGEFLREILVPILPRTYFLWILRIVLIGAVLLHIHAAYTLTVMNRKARPVKYQSARDYQVANFASRTMRWTGIIVALFIVWHLADLTWGWANPDFVRGEVYRNLDASLSRIPVAALYIVANIALGVHLFHGTWSLFQSMGWNNPRFNQWRKALAAGLATIIVVGNVSFPIMTLAGVIDADPDVESVHVLEASTEEGE
jgi:succinate dehydrogenase / fumarate reductase cytochrome b subunit